MSEKVKISLNHLEKGRIIWPNRCAKCGAQKNLRLCNARVGVQTDDGGDLEHVLITSFFRAEAAITISFPVCERHYFQHELSTLILERALLMYVVRFSIYLSFFAVCSIPYRIITQQLTLSQFISGFPHDKLYILFCGTFGMIAILWARLTLSVRFTGLNSRNNVLSIEFFDQKYARDFKIANIEATNARVTSGNTFFCAKNLWKGAFFIIYCILVVFMILPKN